MSGPAEKFSHSPTLTKTAAAKLHVLHLAPIKEKLGGKWAKLSEPVHQLFEKAIRDGQGPRDHFIRLDELSYVVTFNGLSFEEATLACAAIAQEVCEKLFGGAHGDISVRALVGQLSDEILASHFKDGNQISALLELGGQEIIVRSNPGGTPPSTTKVVPGSDDADWEPSSTIVKAEASLLPLGLKIGLFPVWEVAKHKSACMYVSAYSRNPKLGCTRQLLSGLADRVVEAEIALLYAAHAYAQRIHNARKMCALPTQCDAAQAAAIIKKLGYAFAEQKGFIFVEELDTPEQVAAAVAGNVRFGTGQGLNPIWFRGTDPLPNFPLS